MPRSPVSLAKLRILFHSWPPRWRKTRPSSKCSTILIWTRSARKCPTWWPITKTSWLSPAKFSWLPTKRISQALSKSLESAGPNVTSSKGWVTAWWRRRRMGRMPINTFQIKIIWNMSWTTPALSSNKKWLSTGRNATRTPTSFWVFKANFVPSGSIRMRTKE